MCSTRELIEKPIALIIQLLMFQHLHLINFFDYWNYQQASQTEVEHAGRHLSSDKRFPVYTYAEIPNSWSYFWILKINSNASFRQEIREQRRLSLAYVLGTCSSLREICFKSVYFQKIFLPFLDFWPCRTGQIWPTVLVPDVLQQWLQLPFPWNVRFLAFKYWFSLLRKMGREKGGKKKPSCWGFAVEQTLHVCCRIVYVSEMSSSSQLGECTVCVVIPKIWETLGCVFSYGNELMHWKRRSFACSQKPFRLVDFSQVCSWLMGHFYVFQLDPQTLQDKDWQRTVISMNGVSTANSTASTPLMWFMSLLFTAE